MLSETYQPRWALWITNVDSLRLLFRDRGAYHLLSDMCLITVCHNSATADVHLLNRLGRRA